MLVCACIVRVLLSFLMCLRFKLADIQLYMFVQEYCLFMSSYSASYDHDSDHGMFLVVCSAVINVEILLWTPYLLVYSADVQFKLHVSLGHIVG
jgi:hypothetical protein